jgi:hypothetical protein
MKTLFRALIILLAGTALALAFLPLGSTSWADNQRNRRGGRGRPPVANVERPANPGGPGGASVAPGPNANFPREGRGQPGGPGGPGGRGGRGGEPGLFGHFRGNQSFAGNAMRFTQVLVLQIGIPAGLTLTVLAYSRRNRRSVAG